ncbi:MAG: hypothetical protein ACP5DX_01365 [Paracoccaceae bacterium]|jgi:hypothetical protein
MPAPKRYVGIDNDLNGGMTDTGKIIRDARAFGIIPETETCEGWLVQGIEELWSRVDAEWEKYGFRVANLPDDVMDRYLAIQASAMTRARAAGWDGEAELAGDD